MLGGTLLFIAAALAGRFFLTQPPSLAHYIPSSAIASITITRSFVTHTNDAMFSTPADVSTEHTGRSLASSTPSPQLLDALRAYRARWSTSEELIRAKLEEVLYLATDDIDGIAAHMLLRFSGHVSDEELASVAAASVLSAEWFSGERRDVSLLARSLMGTVVAVSEAHRNASYYQSTDDRAQEYQAQRDHNLAVRLRPDAASWLSVRTPSFVQSSLAALTAGGTMTSAQITFDENVVALHVESDDADEISEDMDDVYAALTPHVGVPEDATTAILAPLSEIVFTENALPGITGLLNGPIANLSARYNLTPAVTQELITSLHLFIEQDDAWMFGGTIEEVQTFARGITAIFGTAIHESTLANGTRIREIVAESPLPHEELIAQRPAQVWHSDALGDVYVVALGGGAIVSNSKAFIEEVLVLGSAEGQVTEIGQTIGSGCGEERELSSFSRYILRRHSAPEEKKERITLLAQRRTKNGNFLADYCVNL